MADCEMRIAENERWIAEKLMLNNVINDYKKENNKLTEQVLERDTHIEILDKEIEELKEQIEVSEEEEEEVVELEVTFTWSAEQEGEYQEVHKEVILLDLTDYMEEYLAYKSDPEAIPEMSDWIEGLCGYPGYDGDGDLEQTWVEK
tara:strand:+ start:61 stop:498 length:438 start_codon:yes stop_codon:yes gene_type:complete